MPRSHPIDLVDKLRADYTCRCYAAYPGECVCDTMWPSDYCHEAADEIERLRQELSVAKSQIAELLPFATADAQAGVDIGPGIIEGACPDCDDCRWHQASLNLLSRINAGYFNTSATNFT